jgi:hypothetical protein
MAPTILTIPIEEALAGSRLAKAMKSFLGRSPIKIFLVVFVIIKLMVALHKPSNTRQMNTHSNLPYNGSKLWSEQLGWALVHR